MVVWGAGSLETHSQLEIAEKARNIFSPPQRGWLLGMEQKRKTHRLRAIVQSHEKHKPKEEEEKKTKHPVLTIATFSPKFSRRSFLVETRRDDRWLWEGLQEPLACRGTGLTASYFEGVACRPRHEPRVDRDDFDFIFSSSFKAFYWRQKKASLLARVRVPVCVRVRAAVCFTVRKGSVCIAQYYASLLFPPTLQRAEPHVAMRYLT